jgi:hypothetical protein
LCSRQARAHQTHDHRNAGTTQPSLNNAQYYGFGSAPFKRGSFQESVF